MQHRILTSAAMGGLMTLLVGAQQAFSQTPANVEITVYKGKCATYQVGGKKYECAKVLHAYYPKMERHSFMFDVPGGILSMSGLRPKFSSPKISLTLGLDMATLLLDDGKDVKQPPGKGICKAKFSEDREKLEDLTCQGRLGTTKIDVQFAGDGESGVGLKTESIAAGVDRFYEVYREVGIQGVVSELQECYRTIKYGANIEPLARCFAIDYVAYMIDSGFSGAFGTPGNKYTSSDKMVARAKSNLKKFGYDNRAAERQIMSWVDKIKDWMRETGHL